MMYPMITKYQRYGIVAVKALKEKGGGGGGGANLGLSYI